MRAISLPGYPPWAYMLPLPVAAVILLLGRRIDAAFTLVAGFAAAVALPVKLLVQRPRPGADLVAVVQHLESFSFPSGHATEYTLLFGFVFYLAWAELRAGVPRALALGVSAALVLLVGPSRVWLGEHWASDVLGGYLLGSGLLLLLIWAHRRWRVRIRTANPSPPQAA